MTIKAIRRVHKLLEIFPPDESDLELFSEISRFIRLKRISVNGDTYAAYRHFDFRDSLSPSMRDLLDFLKETSKDEANYYLRMEEVFDFLVPANTVTAQDIITYISARPYNKAEWEMYGSISHYVEYIITGRNMFEVRMNFFAPTVEGHVIPDELLEHIFAPLLLSLHQMDEVMQAVYDIDYYAQMNKSELYRKYIIQKIEEEREGGLHQTGTDSPQTHAPTQQGTPDTAKALRDAYHAGIAKRNTDSIHKYREQLQKEIDALKAAMEEKVKAYEEKVKAYEEKVKSYEEKLSKYAETELALYDIENSSFSRAQEIQLVRFKMRCFFKEISHRRDSPWSSKQ